MIGRFENYSRLQCLKECNSNQNCKVVSLMNPIVSNSGLCRLYRYFTLQSLISNTSSNVYYNNRQLNPFVIPDYLVQDLNHYWPINNNDLSDHIGSADLIPELNVEMAEDRFGNPNSSMFLNNGYASLPPGVYFNSSDFTIIAWIKPIDLSTLGNHAFMSFSNQYQTEIVYVSYGSSTFYPEFVSQISVSDYTYLTASEMLDANVWNHLVARQKDGILFLYLNGTLVGSITNNTPIRHVERAYCYFGHSVFIGELNAFAYFDDLQFYGRALNETELYDLFLYY